MAQITARFEERGIFAMAPTSIFGLTTHYDLGRTGGINFIGIYQRESSAFARPALGFEASANLVAGVNTSLHFRPSGTGRLVSSITNRNGSSEAFLDINGEFALTQPDPNRTGQAYLEEFEGVSGNARSASARRCGSSAACRSPRRDSIPRSVSAPPSTPPTPCR